MRQKIKSNLYEGIFVLRTQLSDEAKEKTLARIAQVISDGGGGVKKTIDWGRKKLAYDIKGAREGHYYVIYFDLPTSSIKDLIRENALNEDLLRSMQVLATKVPEEDAIEFKQEQEVN